LNFAIHHHHQGVETGDGKRVVYDVERNEAHFGGVRVDGRALVWELGGSGEGATLAVEVELDPEVAWLVRCDRVDFPPGGVAYRHTHPGPGIRCLLRGEIRIETEGGSTTYGPARPWFESGPEPVFAAASAESETAFVRVMLLPREWEGKRTIAYVDPADADKPKTQRATIFLERYVELA
jgi:hypothetical protein